MRKSGGWLVVCALILLAIWLAGCSPAAPAPTQAPPPAAVPTQPPPPAAAATAVPTAGEPAAAPPTAVSPLATPSEAAMALPEARQVELEFPAHMNLGESDVIRLTLAPAQAGYVVKAEFPEHQTAQQEVPVERPAGYDLFAVARLDGVAFDLSPQGEQARSLPSGQTISWSWSLTARQPGRQRLALTLLLRWMPAAGSTAAVREAALFSRGMEVQVSSILGMAPAQAGWLGIGLLAVLLAGGGAIALRRRPSTSRLGEPNPALSIETGPGIRLKGEPETLLKTLFNGYARLLVSAEFLSGYSGARTFLAQPIRGDGRADAYTIAKIGERGSIEREFANYEAFVKDTLPPMTARIQHVPVHTRQGGQAALRYTFIGEAGRAPVSLRQALLASPDPELLRQLFSTFGPYWWQQRRPYTFSLGSEYDALLPAHYVLSPESAPSAKWLDGGSAPDEVRLGMGELVRVRNFTHAELRTDGQSLSLSGVAKPGQPRLRLRWLGRTRPERASARVVGTRASLLAERVQGLDLCGLPDPLPRLPDLLAESVHGTRSIVHGDLNLENILVGPGRLVWLIDFARTREGHTLLDFAHLEAEIIGRVLPAWFHDPAVYLTQLAGGQIPLLVTVETLAAQCLFDPSNPREYRLALAVSCLGALKHANLDTGGRQLLYLTAAWLVDHQKL